MDLYEAIKERVSTRNFDSRSIPEDKLKKIFSAVRMAPSMDNVQPWMFIIVRDEDLKLQISNYVMGHKFIAMAPVIVVASANVDEAIGVVGGHTPAYPMDTAAAMTYLILAAEAEGLGTCWIGEFNEERIVELLSIPDSHRIVALTPLGYPQENGEKGPRKPVEQIMCFDEFED